MSTIPTITPKQFFDSIQGNDAQLIDVRTPMEFQNVRAPMAKNIPLDELDPDSVMKSLSQDGPPGNRIYLICQGGGRASKACQKFIDAGYSNVINVEGGTNAWVAAGLPVVRARRTISLERQVRMAAGSLVALGTLLGWLWNSYFLVIPLLVGTGLVFSGMTDTCGMGMLLAKMPWNRIKKVKQSNVSCELSKP